MSADLLFDTGVLVAVERGRFTWNDILNDDDHVTIPAIVVSELLVGVELADEKNRAGRVSFVETLIARSGAVEDFDLKVARAHARLVVHTRKSGRKRGDHDLIIAATAVATDRILVTTDAAAGFGELPGVRVQVLGSQ